MSTGRKVRVLDAGSGKFITRVMKDGVIKDGGRWWNVEREGGEYVIGSEADDPYTRSMYHGGSGRKKNPTKLQRMVNASKRSKKKRVATALKKFLHQQNPGAKLAGAKIQKLAGGVIKITPIKVNAGRSTPFRIERTAAGYQVVSGSGDKRLHYGTSATKAQAVEEKRNLEMGYYGARRKMKRGRR